MKSNELVTIYVALLDEGVEVYWPVKAEKIDQRTFKIVSENSAQEDEIWQFDTGDTVICDEKTLSEGTSAYKNIDVVMENQRDLVDIVVELTPLAVIKG